MTHTKLNVEPGKTILKIDYVIMIHVKNESA